MSCHGYRNHVENRLDTRTDVTKSNPSDPQNTVVVEDTALALIGDPGLRAGDRDRDQVNALLSDAYAKGYLDLAEFEQRSGQVWPARTRGELRPLVADLPRHQPTPDERRAARRVESDRMARVGLRAHVLSYVGGVAIMLGIWLVTAVFFGAGYFWPIWPILGWGIGVASHALPVLARTQPVSAMAALTGPRGRAR